MKLTIFLEHRFEKSPKGYYFGKNNFNKAFWKSYLAVFDKVHVAARVKNVIKPSPGFSRSDSEKVLFYELPYFIGPFQFLTKYFLLKSKIRKVINQSEKIILRVPSSGVSNIAHKILKKMNKDYAVEVVADPYDVLSSGTIKTIFRKFYQNYLTHKIKLVVNDSFYASYVTEKALQIRYPANNAVFATWYSDVNLAKDYYAPKPRGEIDFQSKPLKLICVGSMSSVLYKGQDVLIKAMKVLLDNNKAVELTLVGDGENRNYLEELSNKLEINNHIKFEGHQSSGNAIVKYLDAAHMFVLPSRQEGLPRAMIEAMARGLPCVGTKVGGIPELIDSKYLIDTNDVNKLARLIIDLMENPSKLANMSGENLNRSKRYGQDNQEMKRQEYYQRVSQG